jgi:hypothetical protein
VVSRQAFGARHTWFIWMYSLGGSEENHKYKNPYTTYSQSRFKSIPHKYFLFWFYSQVPALTASVMILHLSLSIAILFQMPIPMFLRSSSMLSSHLIGGHPTLLVPCNVANVNILQGDIH